MICFVANTVKPVLSGHSKRRPKIDFQDLLSLNACQNYCRILQGERSAILLTFIRLPFVIKISVLSIFGWMLKTGFTVHLTYNLIPVGFYFDKHSYITTIMIYITEHVR